MDSGPFIRKGNLLYRLPEGAKREDFDLSDKDKDQGKKANPSSEQKPSNPLLGKLDQLKAHVKARISQAVKSMKMYINFNPE